MVSFNAVRNIIGYQWRHILMSKFFRICFRFFYRSLSVEMNIIFVLVIFRILDLSCQTFSKIQVLDSSFVYFVSRHYGSKIELWFVGFHMVDNRYVLWILKNEWFEIDVSSISFWTIHDMYCPTSKDKWCNLRLLLFTSVVEWVENVPYACLRLNTPFHIFVYACVFCF